MGLEVGLKGLGGGSLDWLDLREFNADTGVDSGVISNDLVVGDNASLNDLD